jgi:uncharacterized protein YndB with AHSA1/START domain
MARNSRYIAASVDDVWAALADGDTYGRWVVGTSGIRAVDPDWPARGSRLHYRIGHRPLRHDGHTEVLHVEPKRCLELEAHAWPFGSVYIQLTLQPEGDGTRVEMVEHPARGAAALVHNRVGDLLLKLRNVEALRRLGRQAQR